MRVERALGKAQYAGLTGLLRRLARVREEVATIEGVRVPFYVRPGRGEPILMLHGFGGDRDGWLMMVAALSRDLPLVIPDLPGFGTAGTIPRGRASARAQARVVGALVERAGGRAHLVGNSMGGGIALRLAHDDPARVASLTLVGSVGPLVVENEVFHAVERGENPMVVRDVDDFERLLALVTERRPPMPRAMRRYIGRRRVESRPAELDLFEGWYRPEEGTGVPVDLERIRARALVVHGELDRVIDRRTGEALARALPGAELILLAGIGHVPQFEAPRRLARLVERFVRRASLVDWAG